MNSVDQVLRLINAFENAGVPYMLVGSLATSYYGGPGMGNGAQFVIQISGDQLSAVTNAIGGEFKMDPQMSIDSVTMTMRHIIEHPATRFKFDLFLLGPDLHDQARFRQRKEIRFEGTTASLPTAEDVIIANLRWSNAAKRAGYAEDTAKILALRAGRLDLHYIRQWTDQHGTRELFEKLLIAVADVQ
jgi:hypothetical protein